MTKLLLFILLNSFSSFLHFLTSLIKFAVWNSGKPRRLKFVYKQEAGGVHEVCPQEDLAGHTWFQTLVRNKIFLDPAHILYFFLTVFAHIFTKMAFKIHYECSHLN